MMTNGEIWLPVPNYEGLYEVSNMGRVVSLNFNGTGARRELKPQRKHHGYRVVRLYKHGKWQAIRLHRLVATVFVPNPKNFTEINHIDENPENNSANNLEWCDRIYNCNYGTRNQRQRKKMTNGKLSKAVVAILPDGTVEEYPSMSEASRQLKCSQGHISDACLGKIRTYHGGRKWKLKDDETD